MTSLRLLLRGCCVSLTAGAVAFVALVRELLKPGKTAFLHRTGGALQLFERTVDAVEAGVGGAVGGVRLDARLLTAPLLLQGHHVPAAILLPLLLLLHLLV